MTDEQLIEKAKTQKYPFWHSRKFWLCLAAIISWHFTIRHMLGVVEDAKGAAIPDRIFWAMMIKGAIETLGIGGIAALDAYATKLPFAASTQTRNGRLKPEAKVEAEEEHGA